MQPLGPGTLGEVFDNARRETTGDAERIGNLARRVAERPPDAGGRAEGAEHRGRMESRAMDRGRRDQRHAAHQLGAHHDPEMRIGSAPAETFARGQYRRHDHRARMDRCSFEAVVEILAVGGCAIDEPLGCPSSVPGPLPSRETITAAT